MIEYTLDKERSTVHVRVNGPLQKQDFEELTKTVDPFIEKTGKLAGLILETTSFPGWENIGAAICHLRFVRDHHKKVNKVAVVTDSVLGRLAEQIASHFVAAEIKRFPAGQLEAAKTWIAS